MTPQSLRKKALRETEKTEALLLAYANHPASSNMLWHGKSTLRGTCAVGAVWLANQLNKKYGLHAFVVHGIFEGESKREIEDKKHCWVICHNGDPQKSLVCDPTIRQFFDLGKTPPVKTPLVTTTGRSCSLGYIPKTRPIRFAFWPAHCHPFALNTEGINHQKQLEILHNQKNL